MKNVIIGLLGSVKDKAKLQTRWDKWRPTVSLCQHDDFRVHRLELLVQPRFQRLATQVKKDIRECSPRTEVCIHHVEMADPWNLEGVYSELHAFAHDYQFNVDKEDYYVHITTGSHVQQISLFLLTEARYFPAQLIQTSPPGRGADGKRTTKQPLYNLIDLDLSKYDRIATRFRKEHREATDFLKSGIATRNKAFNALIDRIEQVAVGGKDPILLIGPTGAGKSQLAERIYQLKKARRQLKGAFVELNCATLRGDTASSSLFGHVKGAYTGAQSERPGLLREADGGVLFLDEIGELGMDEQAMLLRAVETKRFLPLGADHEVSSDFQLIAGTNRDLAEDVSKGSFRDDLLARIDLWTFDLPGLKDRKEDIEPNLDYELQQFADDNARRVTFNKEAKSAFMRFAKSNAATWDRNFRDLNGALRRMCTLSPEGRITAATVKEEIARLKRSWRPAAGSDNGEALLVEIFGEDELEKVDLFDRVQLAEVIRVCRRSKSMAEAGRLLFAASRARRRTTNDADRLRKYLGKWGLDFEAVQES